MKCSNYFQDFKHVWTDAEKAKNIFWSQLDITEEDDSLVLVTESNEKYKCIIPEVSTTKSPQVITAFIYYS